MGLWDNVKDFFAANTYVVATETNVSTNPLEKSVESLNGRYNVGMTEVGDYIKFGQQDDFSIVLEKMFKQSPVHSGIVTKKAKMVAGNDIKYDLDAYKTPAKQAEIRAFLANCAGKSQGLYSQIVHASFQYELHGAFAFTLNGMETIIRLLNCALWISKEFVRLNLLTVRLVITSSADGLVSLLRLCNTTLPRSIQRLISLATHGSKSST